MCSRGGDSMVSDEGIATAVDILELSEQVQFVIFI